MIQNTTSKCSNHVTVVVNNSVYIIVGYDGRETLKSVARIKLDNATPAWKTVEDMDEEHHLPMVPH